MIAGSGLVGAFGIGWMRAKLGLALRIFLVTLGVVGFFAGVYTLVVPLETSSASTPIETTAPSSTAGSVTSDQTAIERLDPPPLFNQTALVNGTPIQGHSFSLSPRGCSSSTVSTTLTPGVDSSRLSFSVVLDDDAPEETNVEVVVEQNSQVVLEDTIGWRDALNYDVRLDGAPATITFSSLNSAPAQCRGSIFRIILQDFALLKGS